MRKSVGGGEGGGGEGGGGGGGFLEGGGEGMIEVLISSIWLGMG